MEGKIKDCLRNAEITLKVYKEMILVQKRRRDSYIKIAKNLDKLAGKSTLSAYNIEYIFYLKESIA